MSSYQNIQTLFDTVIQAILIKLSLDFNLSILELTAKIGSPTITDDLESSIREYCNTLTTSKSKKIVKKNIPEITIETVSASAIAETVKPKKILKKKPIAILDNTETVAPSTIIEIVAPSATVETVSASAIAETVKPKKILKKKPTAETVAASAIAETVSASAIAETVAASPIIDTVKPKKILKKKSTAETVAASDIADTVKPKKILKKKPTAILDNTETVTASTIAETVTASAIAETVTASAIAETVADTIKPNKIMKKTTIETFSIPIIKDIETVSIAPIVNVSVLEPEELMLKPKKIMISKKNVEKQEYGEDIEQIDIYESLETYEEDSLEPQEINGIKYYVDTSGYIYDFENQDLLGKRNQSGDNIILLNDLSPIK